MSNIKIGQRRQTKGQKPFKVLEKHPSKNGQQPTYTVQMADRTTATLVRSKVQSSKIVSRY